MNKRIKGVIENRKAIIDLVGDCSVRLSKTENRTAIEDSGT